MVSRHVTYRNGRRCKNLSLSVPDGQRPHPHPRHGEPAHHHPVHGRGPALPARGTHLLQPAGPAALPDQRHAAAPPNAGRRAVRGLQPGVRGASRLATVYRGGGRERAGEREAGTTQCEDDLE